MPDPVIPPADPAVPPADPATPPADPATPPADPATPPADPATPPADPATPPADPATPPATPPAEPAAIADFSMPEGVTLDTGTSDKLKAMATENGWDQETAQKVASLGAEMMQQQAAAFNDIKDKWTADAKADSEIGGEKFDENLALANKAIDAFGTKDFVDFLKTSGLSNHPEMVRAFHKIGLAIGEDRLVNGNGPTPPGPDTPERRMFPDMTQANA